jgi:hypothetical protein
VVWQNGNQGTFTPVQLKEVVPKALNPTATINGTLAGLSRYGPMGAPLLPCSSTDEGTLVSRRCPVRAFKCGGIWLFGAASPDQQRWYLYGNLLSNPRLYNYEYPA